MNETAWDRSFKAGSYVDSPSEIVRGLLYENLHLAESLGREPKTLDAGCGTGRHAIYLAEKGMNVVALDESKTALAILKSKIVGKPYEHRIEIVRASLDDIPYSDEYFDLVLSIDVLHHNYRDGRRRQLRELRRVLKPYGLLLLAVLSRRDFRYNTGEDIEPNTKVGITDTFDPEQPHHFYSTKELVDAFRVRRDGISKRIEVEEVMDVQHRPFVHHYYAIVKDGDFWFKPHLIVRRKRKPNY